MMSNDWRITNQDSYLRNKSFYFHAYTKWSERWDHEHCEFCWDTISESEETLTKGYSTLDDYYWVCETCFHDFKDQFNLYIVEEEGLKGKPFLQILKNELDSFDENQSVYDIRRIMKLSSYLEPFRINTGFIYIKYVFVAASCDINEVNRILEDPNSEYTFINNVAMTDFLKILAGGIIENEKNEIIPCLKIVVP